MLINIFEDDSEEHLLHLIERNGRHIASSSLVHFRFSEFGLEPNHDDFILAIKDCLVGQKASVYFCRDGDIFVLCRDTMQNILPAMVTKIKTSLAQFSAFPSASIPYMHYDLQNNDEELMFLCKEKIKNNAPRFSLVQDMPVESILPPPKPKLSSIRFTKRQQEILRKSMQKRAGRMKPRILILEDQAFSRLLLEGVLKDQYDTDSCETIKDAIALYAEHAHDIAFLDIELPDGNGNDLARLLLKFDADAFLVMVTAYNCQNNAIQAKENGAKAFIMKPYNNQRIVDCVQMYFRLQKKYG